MPPLQPIVQETSFDEDDEESTYTLFDGTDPGRGKGSRSVRFSPYCLLYQYEGVRKEERHLVWYTREEEAAFAQQEIKHAIKGRSGNRDMKKPNDVSILDQALLLGSMMFHGACLRAMVMGHEVASHM